MLPQTLNHNMYLATGMRACSLRDPGRAIAHSVQPHPIGYAQVLGHLAHPHWMRTDD